MSAADGSFVTSFGQHGEEMGQLTKASAVCVDHDGRILVADAQGRVQVFVFTEWK